MRMGTGWMAMAALLACARPAAAQANTSDGAARDFLAAVDGKRFDQAAAMVLPHSAERIRLTVVSMLLAQAASRASGGPETGVAFTVTDSVDAGQLRRFGGQPVRGYTGAGTVAELAVMPPRAFVEAALANSYTAPVGATDVAFYPHRYIGEVVENDSLAHALYRLVLPGNVTPRGPEECPCAEVLELRRVDGRWYVMLDWAFVATGFLPSGAEGASR